MQTRRGLLKAAGLGAVCCGAGFPLRAQEKAAFDPLREWGFYPNVLLDEKSPQNTVGTAPPRHGEISHAFRLLYQAPRNSPPINVAAYFEQLKDANEDGNRYTYEWPKTGRANPLIVGFFSSTFTVPSSGDQTSWCAAFVNFCLMVAQKPLTNSALSGSFRNNPNYPQTSSPRQGDIVVFRKRGAEGDRGFGHVGFYLSDNGTTIEVLGGNQVGQTGSSGAVTRTSFRYSSNDLELHSFRRV